MSCYCNPTSLPLGKPDVHKLSPGCFWKLGLQEPVLCYYPWRRQGAGVKQSITSLRSPAKHVIWDTSNWQHHMLSCATRSFNNKSLMKVLCSWDNWFGILHTLAATFIWKLTYLYTHKKGCPDHFYFGLIQIPVLAVIKSDPILI